MVWLDPKVKVSRAKKRIALTDLAPGQPIICSVEIAAKPDADQQDDRIPDPDRSESPPRDLVIQP